MKEYTRDEAETSVRNSIRVGGAFEWPLGISTRLNLRYARRQFKGQNAYFRYARADREYQSTLSVWHRRLNFWGVTPKFNWQYNKIDSNISDLYSRAAHRVFFSLDKAF